MFRRDLSAQLQKLWSHLNNRQRRFVVASLAVRASLTMFDLIGIFLVGVVASLFTGTVVSKSSNLSWLLSLGERIGFSNRYVFLVSLAISFFVLKGALSFVVTSYISFKVANIESQRATTVFEHTLKSNFENLELLSREKVLHGLSRSMNAGFSQTILNTGAIFGELVMLAAICIYLALTSFELFLVIAIFFGIVGMVMHFAVGKLTGDAARGQEETYLLGQEFVSDALLNFPQITTSGNIDSFRAKYSRLRKENAEASGRYSSLITAPRYITEIAVMLGIAILLFVPNREFGINSQTTTLAIFLTGIFRIVASMLPLQSGISAFQRIIQESKLAFNLLDRLPKVDCTLHFPKARKNDVDNFEIQLERVSYLFPNAAKPVISNVSFSIPFGARVVLTGKSGSGKSTLTELILGLRDPSAGSILIAGKKPADFRLALPTAIGYVPQRTHLIRGSILENITLDPGNFSYDEARLYRTLKDAQLFNFISSLPDGIHTTVGSGGFGLSGGQLQRIGFARALYQNPRILILDEVTSALDPETESLIEATLDKLRGKVTCLVISHNLKSTHHADLHLKISRGKLRLNP